jgi:hypothetical protein
MHQLAENPEDPVAWLHSSIFARCILPAGRGPREGDAYSQSKVVRERLRRWRAGEVAELWEEAVALTQLRPRAKEKRRQAVEGEKTLQERNAERATRLVQEGQYARGLQALASLGMAEATDDTAEVMRAKHPPAPPPLDPRAGSTPSASTSPPSSPPLSFSQAQVKKASLSFRPGSAPGPSGLRPEHLRAALKGAPPNRADSALAGLTRVVNLMAAGGVPACVAPYLCGARLHAALKKDGGLRPVAIGNLLRRLVSKLVAAALLNKAAGRFSPHQLGVGVRGGCEAVLHTLRRLVADAGDEVHVVQADLVNAFNQADRSAGLQGIMDEFPEALSWAITCYGATSELLFGDFIISSSAGFQQGDPIAGLLFALTLHPVVEKILAEVPDLLLNVWFHDDGTMAGTLPQLRAAIDILSQEGPARGLILSTARTVAAPLLPKTTVWRPAGPCLREDPLERGIPAVQEPGILLLGAPVGSPDFVEAALQERLAKVKKITELLPSLRDPQIEYVVLRSCLALGKFMYNLRTVDTTAHQPLLISFDAVTREALSRILGSPVPGDAWQQANLSASQGGMGLRSARDHAAAAYATSFLASLPILEQLIGSRLEEEAAAAGEEAAPTCLPDRVLGWLSAQTGAEVTAETLDGLAQKMVSAMIDTNHLRRITERLAAAGAVREQARLASLGLPHAGDWLHALPSHALGLQLRPAEFIMAAKLRLGMPVYETAGPCPACLKHCDALGDHALCCAYQGERISRHNRLRDALYHTAVSAALGPAIEGRFLLPGNDRRPADVFIPGWTGGKDSALDVTVTHPLQEATVVGAAKTAGHAAGEAYHRKMVASAADCRAEGIEFLPLAAESLGGWHPVAVHQVDKLAAALARHSGEDERVATRHLWQRLAVTLQKGNAALLNGRKPSFPTPDTSGQF